MRSEEDPQINRNQSSFFYYITIFLRGLFMGAADIVPGVSGGTIAFITGIYEKLFQSINTLNFKALKLFVTFRFKELKQQIAWKFLLSLGGGVGVAIVALSHLFTLFLNHELYHSYLYAAFFGLIIASIFFCGKEIQKWSYVTFLFLFIGTTLGYLFTGSSAPALWEERLYDLPISQEVDIRAVNYDGEKKMLLSLPEKTLEVMVAKGLIDKKSQVYSHKERRKDQLNQFISSEKLSLFDGWLFFCGALAVCGMLLPGISGAYLLKMLGVYSMVIVAIADLTKALQIGQFDQSAFYLLFSVALGILCGALFFARFISWLLRNHKNKSLALLTGFMVGALHTVWPFWLYTYQIAPLKLEEGVKLLLLQPTLPDMMLPHTWSVVAVALLSFISMTTLEFFVKRRKTTIIA